TSKTSNVKGCGETSVEANETFFVNLSSPTGGTIADGQGLGTIINDDGQTLSINDVTVTEGNSGTVNAVFTVSRNGGTTGTVTVNYASADGTATAPADYTATSGSLTFAAGVTTQTITVQVKGDTLDEANETFFVNLSNASGATIFDGQGVGTITDDDLPPTVAFTASTSSGSESVTPANLAVALSGASGQTVTVNYSVTSGSATGGGVDYTLANGTLSFAPGETTKTIAIAVVDDSLDENDETIQVTLSGPSNATLGATSVHTYTIFDNDGPPSLSINDVAVTEGN